MICARRGGAWTLPASLAEAAKRFSHQEGGTLFMALVAALKTLLHRYLGQDDVRVATNVANRNRPGTEGLIGPLVNTVILRTNLGGDPSAREVMRRVRATTLAAFAHQDLPFEELVQTLERERRSSLRPLANVMIIVAECHIAPDCKLRAQAQFRGGQSEHADAPGDDNIIRCYLDAEGKPAWLGRDLRLQAASLRRRDDRSPASRFPGGARTHDDAAGAANLGNPRFAQSAINRCVGRKSRFSGNR